MDNTLKIRSGLRKDTLKMIENTRKLDQSVIKVATVRPIKVVVNDKSQIFSVPFTLMILTSLKPKWSLQG